MIVAPPMALIWGKYRKGDSCRKAGREFLWGEKQIDPENIDIKVSE